MNLHRLSIIAALLMGIVLAATAAEAAPEAKSRSKVIDFEEQLVEGINKRPLDSVSQISEANRRKKKPHLYRKRGGFRTETVQTISDVRYVQ